MPVVLASLPINSVNTHPDLQMRAEDLLSEDHLADLVEALKERDLPRITCCKVYGRIYVTDGHYRLSAYRRLNKSMIPAEVFECGWLEAISMASRANAEHMAKKRTREDKHRAVVTLLNTLFTLGENWSNRKIADAARVSESLVRTVSETHTPVKIEVPHDDTIKAPVKPVPPQKTTNTLVVPKSSQVRLNAPEHSSEHERYPDDDEVTTAPPVPPKSMPVKVLGRDNKEYTIPISDNAQTVKPIDYLKMESSLGSLVRMFDEANKQRPKFVLLGKVKYHLDQVLDVIKQWSKE